MDQDALAEVIGVGTMSYTLRRGEWSGCAGTLPETQLGLPAHVVQELLLIPQARSHGLGPDLSVLLACALPDDGRVLLVTIHAENRGALRAARRDVGGQTRLPLQA